MQIMMASFINLMMQLSEKTDDGDLRKEISNLFRTANHIYRIKLYRMLHNIQEVEDCLQEAYLSAVKNIDDFNSEGELGAWMMRIVINAALLKLRNRKQFNGRMIIFDAADIVRLSEKADPEEDVEGFAQKEKVSFKRDRSLEETGFNKDPEFLLERKQVRMRVQQAVETLPVSQREAIDAFYFRDMKLREISDETGVPMGTISERMTKGRRLLQEILRPDEF